MLPHKNVNLWRRKVSTETIAKKPPEVTIPPRRNVTRRLVAATAVVGLGISLCVRRWRNEKLKVLDYTTVLPQGRDDLLELMERTGQMGIYGAYSVKDELDNIRKWHTDHGYKGGLVLRELTKPLFVNHSSLDMEEVTKDPMQMARRECYYLYYEIRSNGEINQQIFCRGTTLAMDVLTCVLFWMVYDEELECRLHLGFRNQADRILQDIEPLLAPSSDERTTIEVSGHSLGGAVAYIVAAKLRKRGYRVVRATAVAAPRFCASAHAAYVVASLLPTDNLRVENDTDVVPFLPPFAHHVGNKLYLVEDTGKMAYVPSSSQPWLGSVFLNFRAMELVAAKGETHRVPHHVDVVRRALHS